MNCWSQIEIIFGRMSQFLVAEVIVSIGEMTCGECERVIRRKLKMSGSVDLSRMSFAIYSVLFGSFRR